MLDQIDSDLYSDLLKAFIPIVSVVMAGLSVAEYLILYLKVIFREKKKVESRGNLGH